MFNHNKVFLVTSLVTLLAGCASIEASNANKVNSNVRALISGNMFQEFTCVRQSLFDNANSSYVILVESILDGTVKKDANVDGKLSDSGTIQMKSTLTELIPSSKGVVMNIVPAIFRAEGGGGINEYGSISSQAYKRFSSEWSKRLGVTPGVILINGEFTRFDGDQKTYQESNGFNFGNDGTNGDGDSKIGFSKGNNSISLTVNVVAPVNQSILTTQSFTADVGASKKEVSIRLGPGEGAIGYSYASERSLTPHEVQQHLIDIASIWVVSKLYNNVMPAITENKCLSDKQLLAITDVNIKGE